MRVFGNGQVLADEAPSVELNVDEGDLISINTSGPIYSIKVLEDGTLAIICYSGGIVIKRDTDALDSVLVTVPEAG